MHYYVLLRSMILWLLHLACQWSIYHGRKKHYVKDAVSLVRLYGKGKGKGKADPLQARRGPEGSRKLRFPDFVTTAQDGGRLSALRTGRLTPRKYSRYSFLLEAESTPGPQCDRKDFMSMKNPLTPAGIGPVTYRFVAQHLNHCATAFPQIMWQTNKI